jgi:hypothetical protein
MRTWGSINIGHGIRIGRSMADSELRPKVPGWRRFDEPSASERLCHVRGFYLSIGRGPLSARMFIFQCLRALAAEPNRLGNRLFLANVTRADVCVCKTGRGPHGRASAQCVHHGYS